MSAIGYAYEDGAVREDLMGILTNLTPTDTQLVTGLGISDASATRHEWLTDTLSAVKTNAYVEGADASFPTITNPTRLLNYTQIFRQGYSVSDTERAVKTAAFTDRFAYEGIKALKMLKNDMEYAIMRGSLACGSATAGQMRGIKNWLSIITSQSGISLTEATLNDYLQTVWENGSDVNAIYSGVYIKRKISSFTANGQKNYDQNDRRLINAVDIYESDTSPVIKLFKHKHVTVAGDTNYDIVGINEELFKVAYLRKPFDREIPRTGDATKGEVVTEATLECLHQHGGFLAKEHV